MATGDSDSEEEVGWDDDGEAANTPTNGVFGFLPNNVNEMNDDSEMFPDEAQVIHPIYPCTKFL